MLGDVVANCEFKFATLYAVTQAVYHVEPQPDDFSSVKRAQDLLLGK